MEYAVLKDDRIAKLSYSEKTVSGPCGGTITTSTWFYVKGYKLYKAISHHEDNQYASHSWSDEPVFIDEVKYVYSDEDIEDAKLLIRMQKYFPNLKPSRVSAVVKELIKRLTRKEK